LIIKLICLHQLTTVPIISLFCGLVGKQSCVGNNALIAMNKEDKGFDLMSIHAERNVLLKYQKLYNGKNKKTWNLLVIRISRNGQSIGISRPCHHCLQHLQYSGIKLKHIYYTTQTGGIEKETFSNMKSGYISTAHK